GDVPRGTRCAVLVRAPALAAGAALGDVARRPSRLVLLVRGAGGLVPPQLVLPGADLLEPLRQPWARAQRSGQRGGGLVRAQQARDVQPGDVLVRERGRDRLGLALPERGEPGPGVAGIEDPLDVAGGLAMTDQE